MKKMKKIFLTVLMGALASLSSCSDETFDPVASNSTINLTAPTGGSFVLSAGTAGSTATTVKWTSADFGFNAAVTYSLQAVKSSQSFTATSGSFPLGTYSSTQSSLEKALTQRQLNNLILSANGNIGTAETFKIRVIGRPSTQLATSTNGVIAISNEVTITVTPYDTFDEFNRIYVPGSYQSASGYGNSWSPDHANVAKLFSPNNDGNYEGFVWMNEANPQFKFTPVPAWNGDKGDASSSGNTGNLAAPGNNVQPVDGAGTYFFQVNWNNNTYVMSKRQVAIIGAATPNGWGTPTYMTFDTNPTSPYFQMYKIDIQLSNNEFLIRMKDDWSVKFGSLSGGVDNVTNNGSQYKVKLNGGNMKMPTAGNYRVVLDIRNSANYNIRFYPI